MREGTLFFTVQRALSRLGRARTWTLPVLIITLVFVTSWPLMAWAEPPGNPIAEPANYWWWFMVTASTVGYGDFFPQSTGGHLVGVYVIIGGIATLTTLITNIAEQIQNAKGRRMKGMADLNLTDHTVILGYAPGRTERIVEELTAEGNSQIALCAWEEVETNPMPTTDAVEFVRGDLTREDVLRRACVHTARSLLVDVRDDNEALAVTVAAYHVNPDVHSVVALRDMSRARNVSYVDNDVRCVQWHSPRMLTEELQDPGISQVYANLMTHGGGNTYSFEVTGRLGNKTVGDYQLGLGRRFSATVLGARADGEVVVSPDWGTTLPVGSMLYYVGTRRLTEAEFTAALEAAR